MVFHDLKSQVENRFLISVSEIVNVWICAAADVHDKNNLSNNKSTNAGVLSNHQSLCLLYYVSSRNKIILATTSTWKKHFLICYMSMGKRPRGVITGKLKPLLVFDIFTAAILKIKSSETFQFMIIAFRQILFCCWKCAIAELITHNTEEAGEALISSLKLRLFEVWSSQKHCANISMLFK